MWSTCQSWRTWRVQPPALIAFRVPAMPVGLVVSPARKRWSHSSQWGAMPRYPSQMAMKMAAYAMELGLKL